jgi:hypothetical protein
MMNNPSSCRFGVATNNIMCKGIFDMCGDVLKNNVLIVDKVKVESKRRWRRNRKMEHVLTW